MLIAEEEEEDKEAVEDKREDEEGRDEAEPNEKEVRNGWTSEESSSNPSFLRGSIHFEVVPGRQRSDIGGDVVSVEIGEEGRSVEEGEEREGDGEGDVEDENEGFPI